MQNKEIAQAFKLLSSLMDIHGENAFKSRSYSNAGFQLSRISRSLAEMTTEELKELPGVGEAIAQKITQLVDTGKMDLLDRLLKKTPAGIVELVSIRGIGPKKVGVLWKELGIESAGELLYACGENRLLGLKGFGEKTQLAYIDALEYYMQNRNSFLYAQLEQAALEFVKWIQEKLPKAQVSLTGAIRRKCEVVERIEVLVDVDSKEANKLWDGKALILGSEENGLFKGISGKDNPIWMFTCTKADFAMELVRTTGSEDHLNLLGELKPAENEVSVYKQAKQPFVPPEMREGYSELEQAKKGLDDLLELSDIRGILHAHSTYSDGRNTLKEMAEYCKELGYGYLGISDHSKSAVYAGGLTEDEILRQHDEIDKLNEELAPFVVLKGIESDILTDGSLDYDAKVLDTFDFVIASVHGQLSMDKPKATKRLLGAIQDPHTKILGHPTARLLLSRAGFELDWDQIIKACAKHKVCIELNANPRRLDIDWRLIPKAVEQGVLIAVNPDAHSQAGVLDVHFGVLAARKAGLLSGQTLNCRSVEELLKEL